MKHRINRLIIVAATAATLSACDTPETTIEPTPSVPNASSRPQRSQAATWKSLVATMQP